MCDVQASGNRDLIIKETCVRCHAFMFAGSVKMAVLVITKFPRALETESDTAWLSVDRGDPVGGTSVLQICRDWF